MRTNGQALAREGGARTSAGKRCDWGAGASEQGTSPSWSKEEEYQSRPGQHEDSAWEILSVVMTRDWGESTATRRGRRQTRA